MGEADLLQWVRDVPDFPKKGIVFKDISPLLGDPKAFKAAVDRLCGPYGDAGIKKVAGIESRGFILAAAMAHRLGTGLIPIRKKGKLPRRTVCASYALEYGTDSIEAHADAASPGERVLLVDDVLATGGTAAAACELLSKLRADIAGACFLIELDFLKGRDKLQGRAIHSLIHY